MGKPASVKLSVVMADRHGEFATHQPSPPVFFVVICIVVQTKKNTFKINFLLYSPKCRSKKRRKTPEKAGRSPQNKEKKLKHS